MNIERFDVFENEAEMTDMIEKLQASCLEHMAVPDDLWHTKTPKIKIKSKKEVLATL
ncbi:MAG: hypothetical protein NC200_00610 [Candidatus Gastranaerophilales bacterium]|nr:hypothetical protein [Candidatus Gastranaerophilales bacterium]